MNIKCISDYSPHIIDTACNTDYSSLQLTEITTVICNLNEILHSPLT